MRSFELVPGKKADDNAKAEAAAKLAESAKVATIDRKKDEGHHYPVLREGVRLIASGADEVDFFLRKLVHNTEQSALAAVSAP